MKVECRISEDEQAPGAVIRARRMTPALAQAIALLENEGAREKVVAGRRDGKVFFLRLDSLELVRTEGREVVAYDAGGQRFVLGQPLYALEELLGDAFVRVSKSALVRITAIDHVEASFHGTMRLVLRSGIEDSISRSCRRKFKERLGI